MMNRLATPRILVVDDDEANRTLLRRHLESAGYDVVLAVDGTDALAQVPVVRPDLVVLDVLMPGLSGFDVCRRMRNDPAGRDVPVLLLTAVDELEASDAALRCGGDDYLAKPFRRLQLLMRVQNLLALSKQYKQMNDHVRALERERAEAMRTQAERELWMSMAVHDLKGPLAAVVSNASFLGEQVAEHVKNDDEPVEAVQDVIRAAERMKAIIGRTLTQKSAEPVAVSPQRLDLSDLAAQLRRADRDGRIVVSIAPSAQSVVADRELLQRLLENLVDNARKYAPGSAIYLDASRDGAEVVIRVRDEGPGIPRDVRHDVFLPRRRLDRDRETSPDESAGLGLSFCKLAATAHGGSIDVEDNAPHGASFVVRLPQGAPN